MTCEDVELELSAPQPSQAALEHAQRCARCGATAQVLSLSALPPLGAGELHALKALPRSTGLALEQRRSRASRARAWVALSLAAALGALLASVGILALRQPAAAPAVETVAAEPADVPAFDFPVEEVSAPEELGFDEVGWPAATEGEL